MTHDEYTGLIDLRSHILFGHEVHPVIYRTDKCQVSHPVVRHECGRGHASFDILDRLPSLVFSVRWNLEPVIDFRHGLSDEIPILAIGFNVVSSRDGHLKKGERPTILGVSIEKILQCPQTLHQTLGVIQTIDTESDSNPSRNTQASTCASHEVFDLHRLCEIGKQVKVHADRTCCQFCLMPAIEHNRLRRIDGDGGIQELRHTICKCRRIRHSLEGETIGC